MGHRQAKEEEMEAEQRIMSDYSWYCFPRTEGPPADITNASW